MTPEIVCSLGADALPKRLAEIRAIGRESLVAVSPEGALRFRADRATRARLGAVLAASPPAARFSTSTCASRTGSWC